MLSLPCCSAAGTTPTPWSTRGTSSTCPGCPRLDLRFHLGVDGICYPLVVLTALLTLLCCVYTLRHVPEAGRATTLLALLLVLEVGILGTFLALDLVLFFVFFEVVLLPMYAVIAGLGRPGPTARGPQVRALHAVRLGAAAGRACSLVVVQAGTGDIVALSAAGGAGLSHGTQFAAFALFAVAFAVKARSGRCTPGCPTRTPRRRRSAPCCSPACC